MAQQTLESALEGWKEGKTPDDLLGESPAITVQEPEWESGTNLVEYQLVNEGDAAGPNFVAVVKLKRPKDNAEPTEKCDLRSQYESKMDHKPKPDEITAIDPIHRLHINDDPEKGMLHDNQMF